MPNLKIWKNRQEWMTILPFIFFGFITQIISILHAPSKTISNSPYAFCNYYINKLNIFNVHIDCDAQYFLLDSQNPMRMLNGQSLLLDRPLHSFIVFILSKVFNLVGIPSGPITYLGADGIPQTYDLLNYAIFIGLNAIILFASMLLALKVMLRSRVMGNRYSKIILVASLVMIVQNPINREFFWTPHSQMFNILIPCLIFYLLQEKFVITKRRYLVLMILISALLLIYPPFFLVIPIFFIKTLRFLGKTKAILISITTLPKLLWPSILSFLGGTYDIATFDDNRRFVWVIDSLESKSLTKDLVHNGLLLLQSLPGMWVIVFLIIIILGLLGVATHQAQSGFLKTQYFRDSVLVFGIYFLAIALIGEYFPRFSTGPVILLALLILKETVVIPRFARYQLVLYLALISANSWFWVSMWRRT